LAAASMAEAAGGLKVNKARMRKNIEATLGAVFAERAMVLLGAALGRDVAYELVEEGARKSIAERRRLAEVLAEIPEVSKVLDKKTLRELEAPEKYLGVAIELRKRLLSGESAAKSKKK